MRKVFILILGILILNFAFALEIEETFDTNIMVPEVDTKIELTLNINNATPGIYNVYTLADIQISPMETFQIDNTKSIEKTFILSSTESLETLGYYTFTYTINQRGVEKFDNKFTVNLINLEDAIEISSDNIDTSSNEIVFYVENKENVYLRDLKATFSSIVFEAEAEFNLAPFERKQIKVVADGFKLKKTKAGVYVIESTFETLKGNKKIEGTLFLGEKKGITTNEDLAGFLIKTQTISKINTGNTFVPVEISMSRNIISRLFTTFNIDPTIIERNGFFVEYTWAKERLGPAEIMTIKANTNYLLPILIIIFAVLAFFGIKRFSEAKIQINKVVSPVKTKGGEFALRVTLSIKALKSIENLTLIDKIPHILKLYKKFGSVQPDKIDPQTRRIHWNIGDLGVGEERFLTYIAYSKIGVVGKFSLPRALAVFERDENVHEVESNSVFFMNEQVTK